MHLAIPAARPGCGGCEGGRELCRRWPDPHFPWGSDALSHRAVCACISVVQSPALAAAPAAPTNASTPFLDVVSTEYPSRPETPRGGLAQPFHGTLKNAGSERPHLVTHRQEPPLNRRSPWAASQGEFGARQRPTLPEMFTSLLNAGSRCIVGSWQILRSSPRSAAPPDHPRWCRQPARGLTWVVPCTCESDSNCSPPLRATRAQAAWSQEPALALKAQATPLPAPPRATPVNGILQLREAHDSRVSCPGCCPNWPSGERQGSRAHHGRHHVLGSESAWRAASAREKLFLPWATLELDSHPLALPKASPQGPRRRPSRPRLSAFSGSS